MKKERDATNRFILVKLADFQIGQILMSSFGDDRDMYIIIKKDSERVHYKMLSRNIMHTSHLPNGSSEFWTIQPIENLFVNIDTLEINNGL